MAVDGSNENPERPAGQACPFHRWQEDFPIRWEADHYVTRRELTKFLTLGSCLLVGANAGRSVRTPLRLTVSVTAPAMRDTSSCQGTSLPELRSV